MNLKNGFFIFLLLVTGLRVGLIVSSEPSPNEAYFQICGEHPAPAYFDGPPATAFIAGLFGSAELFWRLTSPLWALAASLACFSLIRRLSEEKWAVWTTVALNLIPVFNAGALRIRPEIPALTFALLGLLWAWQAFDAGKGNLIRWVSVGLAFGMAAMFDYSAYILVPGVALFTLCSPKHRTVGDVFGLVLMAALPVLMLTPSLMWNASLDWIPIAGGTFQTLWEFELVSFVFSLARLVDKFSPFLLIGLVVAWIVALRGMRTHLRVRFVAVAILPAAIMAIYMTLRGEDAVFYTLIAAPLLLFKAVSWVCSIRFGKTIVWSSAVVAVFFSVLSSAWAFSAGARWKSTGQEVRNSFLEESAKEGQEGLFLIASDPPIASILGHELRGELIPPDGHPPIYVRESQAVTSQFGLWPSYDDFIETGHVVDEYFQKEHKAENPFIGRSALYISRESPSDVPQAIKGAFESITFLRKLPPAGNETEPLYIYLCLNYQSLPL